MVPASITATSVIAAAGTTVNEFGAAILLVAGLGLGIWGVRFVIGLVKRARS